MPPGFRFVQHDVDVWTAWQLDRNRQWRETTDGRFIHVVGRLAADATINTAQSEMEAIAGRLAATYTFNRNTGVTVTPLREVLTGQVRTSVLVLFAGVGVLLSIACLNVANMLLARSASRHREIAIRVSLGAGRWAIARSRSLGTLLFGVTAYDLPTCATVIVLLSAIAALASYLPALRAARIEPLMALRQE